MIGGKVAEIADDDEPDTHHLARRKRRRAPGRATNRKTALAE